MQSGRLERIDSDSEITSALARRECEGSLTTAERDRAVRKLNTDLAAYIDAARAEGLTLTDLS
jgi:hypothetical protein